MIISGRIVLKAMYGRRHNTEKKRSDNRLDLKGKEIAFISKLAMKH